MLKGNRLRNDGLFLPEWRVSENHLLLLLSMSIDHQFSNFIDTANNYQGEESEEWIGEWMKARGNREQMVIATKYSKLPQDRFHVMLDH